MATSSCPTFFYFAQKTRSFIGQSKLVFLGFEEFRADTLAAGVRFIDSDVKATTLPFAKSHCFWYSALYANELSHLQRKNISSTL